MAAHQWINRTTYPCSLRLLLVAFSLIFFTPSAGLAQLYLAPNFSLSPNMVNLGGCYTIRVPNWAGAVLNVGYTASWTGQQYIYGWPSLDGNGNAFICTNTSTHTGTYTYNYASNNYYYQWWAVNSTITVNPYAPPQQPTSLTFSSASGYAGLDCYTMTMGGAGNMTVDLYYSFNSTYQPVWSTAMDGGGQWRYCINHHDQAGNYIFYDMRNHLTSDWVTVSPPVSYLVKPPQPSWFLTSPASIVQGNPYQMSVGNGAAVTLDVQYTLNDGPVQTITGWPTLVPGDGNYGYNGSSMGYVNIWTGSETPQGKYVFTAIRSTQNTDWVPATAPLSVCPNAAPTISSITPSAVPLGSSSDVTIVGTNLCAVLLQSVTNNGLSFSNVIWNYPFTSVTATANASSSASMGQGQVRLTSPAGSVTAQFTIAAPAVLTKEYIYLGGRVITSVSP